MATELYQTKTMAERIGKGDAPGPHPRYTFTLTFCTSLKRLFFCTVYIIHHKIQVHRSPMPCITPFQAGLSGSRRTCTLLKKINSAGNALQFGHIIIKGSSMSQAQRLRIKLDAIG